MAFSVGDRVRIVSNCSQASATHNGKRGVVKKVSPHEWVNAHYEKKCGRASYDVRLDTGEETSVWENDLKRENIKDYSEYRKERELAKNEYFYMAGDCVTTTSATTTGNWAVVDWQWAGGTAPAQIKKPKGKKDMASGEKHYRVIKDTAVWEVGAIISNKDGGYKAINELYNKECVKDDYFESSYIVEQSPEFFERVYPVGLLTKTVYKAKAEAREMLAKEHTA